MLRDPEHARLFLVEMSAGEGIRMLMIPEKVADLMSEPELFIK
jgi:hypothetical protein